jgi:enoyl-CoA hydratase
MSDPGTGPDTGQPFENLLYDIDGRVVTISLNRPQYRNAQSRRLLEEFDTALAAAVDDAEVRVVVVRGEGEHFSSGHDLGTPEELADREARPWPEGQLGEQRRSWELNVANTLRWRDLAKPTIASVHGLCIYGAWMLASAMDLIVAADDARFLPAHFQYFSVPWEFGPRKTKELLWRAEFVTAEQALELGFVNHVVPRAELDEFTADLASQISRQDPFVASMIKRSVNEMQDQMGFRTAVTAAHSTYMQIQGAGMVVPKGQEGKIRKLPSVESSFKREDPDGT